MSIVNAVPLLAAAGGDYTISRSVRLRSSASAYFNRTPAGAGSQTTWTWSGWVKRGALGGTYNLMQAETSSNTYTVLQFSSDNIIFDVRNGGAIVGNKYTSAVYRDPSAWYHIVLVWDTTNATASDRMRVYVNGVRVTAFGTSNDPSSSAVSYGVNGAVAHRIGAGVSFANYFDGYLTEINFIDGQALTPSSFGENDTLTGVWKPKKYTGTYGTNGFYLNFSDNSNNTATTIGKDYSGNGNNWTPNNISVTSGVTYDSMIDTPTPYADGGNGRGNYCVVNPLKKSASATITDGNLTVAINVLGGEQPASFAVSSGKWYWEVTPNAAYSAPGILLTSRTPSASSIANDYHYYGSNGQFYTNTSGVSYGSTFGNGDVIGVALNLDTNQITFYKNGTSQGAKTIVAGEYNPDLAGATTVTNYANFGQRPFAYTPPTGFNALNTQNLPDSTIKRGDDYFGVVTRAGTGASAAISSYRFAPDFVWIKARTNAYYHKLLDKVRGANKILSSNATDAESTETQGLMSFDSNGYTLGTSSDSTVNNSGSGQTYVDWAWKESATAGFDIVTYTGTGANRTVAHGLGVAPNFVIIKDRSAANNWSVNGNFGSLIYGTNYLQLNLTNALVANTAQVTAVSSSNFSLGTGLNVNTNGNNYVAYLFAEVAGFSKFGSYTGNGSSTDGPFVWCGFRPRFILTKNITTGGYWWEMVDSAREPINPSDQTLYANVSDSEYTSSAYNKDLLSNGFKIRGNNGGHNASGDVYIFAAFAENPFKNSLAR